MDRLNFNHLFYFYVVAKEGSIKTAGEKIFVSQPTISDQIKLLEKYFDCQLFKRQNRALYLTEEGKLALEYCEQIFELSREVTTLLRNKSKNIRTSLEVGITHHMSQYFLYDIIMPLFDQSQMTVKIRENQRHLLLADLEENQIDIMFTDNRDSLSSSMESYRVGINKTFVIAHKKFKKFKRNFPKDLGLIPYFSYTNESNLKYEINLFFSKNAITPKIIGESDDIGLFQMITEKGLGFTIVPEVAKNRICHNSEVIVLGEIKELQTSVWGIVKKSYRGLGFELINNS